jgi:hypothetical protein
LCGAQNRDRLLLPFDCESKSRTKNNYNAVRPERLYIILGRLMMKKQIKKSVPRRGFLNTIAASSIGLGLAPYINCGKVGVAQPLKRTFGQLDFDVTTMGLGGQGALQWTPGDVDPVTIILKAFELGINYYDTSNLYGPWGG